MARKALFYRVLASFWWAMSRGKFQIDAVLSRCIEISANVYRFAGLKHAIMPPYRNSDFVMVIVKSGIHFSP